jgi:osmotically inducible lipoprotein OsmB
MINRHHLTPILVLAALPLLAACGETRGQRAITGAAIGGVAGAAVDEPLLGAGAGAATGALTAPGN